jgi:hypothetical protein
MEITLNHTIVAAKNNVESAKFYEKIFGFESSGAPTLQATQVLLVS